MELPDAVLAFKLFDTDGLSVRDKQLMLTACPSVLFSDMKLIFVDKIVSPHECSSTMPSADTPKWWPRVQTQLINTGE